MATKEKKTDLPPYSELILQAIDGLKEKNGSSQPAISNYIESKHKNLPDNHADQLSESLEKLKDSGKIVFSEETYKRSETASPIKRGRGRPPKPKPAGFVAAPKRPRGRPPKSGGVATSPKSRGRPPKKPRVEAPAPSSGPKRGRGRPPKAKPAVAAVGA